MSRPFIPTTTDRPTHERKRRDSDPDGIAFDAFSNLWCTLIMVDQLVALTPQCERRRLLDAGGPEAARTCCSA